MSKIKVKKWELFGAILLWFVMGLWIGYMIGGSSSWIAKPEWRESIRINVPVYICIVAFVFLVLESVVDYIKVQRFKKIRNQLKKNVE